MFLLFLFIIEKHIYQGPIVFRTDGRSWSYFLALSIYIHTYTHTHICVCVCIHIYIHRYSCTFYINRIIQNRLFWNLLFFWNMSYVFRALSIFIFILLGDCMDFCAKSYLSYWWTLKLLPVISAKSSVATSAIVHACLCTYVRMWDGHM